MESETDLPAAFYSQKDDETVFETSQFHDMMGLVICQEPELSSIFYSNPGAVTSCMMGRWSISLTAISYYVWTNGGPGAMRVWIPIA